MSLLWRSWWLHFSTGCLLGSGGVAGVTSVKVLREYCRWWGRDIGAGCYHMLASLMSVNAVTECRLSKGSLWLVGSHMWAGCQHAVQAAVPFSVQPLSDPCILQSSSTGHLTPWKTSYSVSEPLKKCCHWMDRGISWHGHSHMGNLQYNFREDAFALTLGYCCLFFPLSCNIKQIILTWTKQRVSCQSLILLFS